MVVYLGHHFVGKQFVTDLVMGRLNLMNDQTLSLKVKVGLRAEVSSPVEGHGWYGRIVFGVVGIFASCRCLWWFKGGGRLWK